MAANDIKAALYAKLTGDATLSGLLSAGDAVYDGIAPIESNFPYVIVQKMDGRPQYTFSQRAFDTHVFLVKGVTKGATARRAGEIAARIDALLTDGALTISGGSLLYCRREQDVDYPDHDGGDVFRHCGATYKLYVE
jgi:hypothetical protein